LLLLLYNFFFVLPLIIILLCVHSGTETKQFEAWREKYRGYMRLAIGFLLIGLGVWMINFIL
jgi:cytochrome c biogenesis protein CcdA